MCRTCVALLLLAAGGAAAHGQALERLHAPADTLSAAQSLAGLQARADSLALAWRRASALADMVDSLRHAPAPSNWDTIRVGALLIISNRSPLPLREAAIRAWPVVDSLYGPDASQLARQPILVTAYDPDTTAPRPASRGTVQVPWNLDAQSLTSILLASVEIGPADSAVRNWLGEAVRPALLREGQRTAVYLQLVTAPSEVAQRCFAGAIASCRDAVGLTTAPDPVSRWYPSPAERRALVARTFFVSGPERDRLQRCLGNDDAACLEVLRALPPENLPRPLGNEARETLLHLALGIGGREAYHRLMAAADHPMADRLAVAAGISVDSLIARWRVAVLAARPVPLTLPSWGVGISLGWALFFALCGLRSSRWRVS